jgi:hypothetical protein
MRNNKDLPGIPAIPDRTGAAAEGTRVLYAADPGADTQRSTSYFAV